MRTFIAIALPDTVREYLHTLQNILKQTNADVKWVEPQHIHLTLRFLGDIDETLAEQVKKAMAAACASQRPFAINLSSIGGFPSSTSPRVVWMGIHKGIGPLKDIASRLEEELAGLGMKEDRPFAAHITLGRTRSSRNRKELAAAMHTVCDKRRSPAPFMVNHITLYQSKLSPKGPAYIPLQETPLPS